VGAGDVGIYAGRSMTVEIKYGADDVKWGADDALWGAELGTVIAENTLFAFGISAQYPDGTAYHVWTGNTDLTVGGITYTGVGPDVLQVGTQQASLTGQGRMSIVLSSISVEHRNLFLQDPGRVRITVRMLYSTNHGIEWRAIAREHSGYLSRPQLQGGQYTVEIAVYRDELNRGFDENWSDAAQRRDYPGDLGLEHLKVLSSGLDIRWP